MMTHWTRQKTSVCTQTPSKRRKTTGGLFVVLLAGLLVPIGSVPAIAQSNSVSNARIEKLESQVKALQRQVFPGGSAKYFPPEISQPATTPARTGTATDPITDILARMNALEAQLASLTAQVEQNTRRLDQIEASLGTTSPATPPVTQTPPASAAAAAPPPPPAIKADSARRAAVEAIERPQTGDAGEDAYTYGFRLWDAKFYPEAQQQLQLYLKQYPGHRMTSFGRNLLGRAYADAGDPTEAAKWFLQNYQNDKSGARAPDSLVYLAKAMKDMKDTKRACIALAEFSEMYPAEAMGRLKNEYDSTRKGLTCS